MLTLNIGYIENLFNVYSLLWNYYTKVMKNKLEE